jgi:hypothetical protein
MCSLLQYPTTFIVFGLSRHVRRTSLGRSPGFLSEKQSPASREIYRRDRYKTKNSTFHPTYQNDTH